MTVNMSAMCNTL